MKNKLQLKLVYSDIDVTQRKVKIKSEGCKLKTKDKYSRVAKFYDKLEELLVFNSYKEEIVGKAKGNILEVGIGTGENLKYYKDRQKVTGVDFSSGMLEIARRKSEAREDMHVKLLEMDIQDMTFKDNSFDSVVSTCVFCTVPDPIKGLKEVYRVLKPGGKVIMLEHMMSRHLILKPLLYFINIFSKAMLGTSMVRRTQDNIENVGFKVVERRDILFDIARIIVAEKEM